MFSLVIDFIGELKYKTWIYWTKIFGGLSKKQQSQWKSRGKNKVGQQNTRVRCLKAGGTRIALPVKSASGRQWRKPSNEARERRGIGCRERVSKCTDDSVARPERVAVPMWQPHEVVARAASLRFLCKEHGTQRVYSYCTLLSISVLLRKCKRTEMRLQRTGATEEQRVQWVVGCRREQEPRAVAGRAARLLSRVMQREQQREGQRDHQYGLLVHVPAARERRRRAEHHAVHEAHAVPRANRRALLRCAARLVCFHASPEQPEDGLQGAHLIISHQLDSWYCSTRISRSKETYKHQQKSGREAVRRPHSGQNEVLELLHEAAGHPADGRRRAGVRPETRERRVHQLVGHVVKGPHVGRPVRVAEAATKREQAPVDGHQLFSSIQRERHQWQRSHCNRGAAQLEEGAQLEAVEKWNTYEPSVWFNYT